MDESEHRHLDAAQSQWARQEARNQAWSRFLRVLPPAAVGLMLLVAFRVFS